MAAPKRNDKEENDNDDDDQHKLSPILTFCNPITGQNDPPPQPPPPEDVFNLHPT